MDGMSDVEAGFAELERAVAIFGSALGAMDHGGPAAEMEADGNDIIRRAFAYHPGLSGLLPELAQKQATDASLADDGYDIRDQIAAARAQKPF